MSQECKFFIYLLEHYAEYTGRPANEILQSWDELGITDTIYECYEIYHVERLQNAFDDIEAMTAERKTAIANNGDTHH